MTTLAYRDGVLAADSRELIKSEAGGERFFHCEKLFRKRYRKGKRWHEAIIATAGESSSGMEFVDWYGTSSAKPQRFLDGDADFVCLVLTHEGLFEFDKWCRGVKIAHPNFYAAGAGAFGAMCAMHAGATAQRAVEIVCEVAPHSGLPVVTMSLSPR